MRILLILTFCIQAFICQAQTPVLIDALNNKHVYYEAANQKPFTGEKAHSDAYFHPFKLIDSTDHRLMNNTFLNYIDSLHRSNYASQAIQLYEDSLHSNLQDSKQNQTLEIHDITLQPISLLDNTLFIRYRIRYKTKQGYNTINTYFAYDIKTGETTTQNQIKERINKEKFFVALKRKWASVTEYLDFKTESSYIDNVLLNEKDNRLDTNQSTLVLPKISQLLEEMNLDDIDLFWTGAGIMVQFNKTFISAKKQKFYPFQLHLDINEIPSGCFKASVFPKSFSKRVTNTEIQKFRSLLSMRSTELNFISSYINLLNIEDHSIEQMDLSLRQDQLKDIILKVRWLYTKGRLVKHISNPDQPIHTEDSILWKKDDFIGYVTSKISPEKRKKRTSVVYTTYDKNDNLLGIYTARHSIHAQRSVFINDNIASFSYSIFGSHRQKPFNMNWYSRMEKGWSFIEPSGKRKPYIIKNDNKPWVIGDRTYLYNQDNQIVHDWLSRYESVLYHYDKNGVLKEVNKTGSSNHTTYQYKYDNISQLLEEIKLKNKNNKKESLYYLNWK